MCSERDLYVAPGFKRQLSTQTCLSKSARKLIAIKIVSENHVYVGPGDRLFFALSDPRAAAYASALGSLWIPCSRKSMNARTFRFNADRSVTQA